MVKERINCLIISERIDFVKLREVLKHSFKSELNLIHSLPSTVASFDLEEFHFGFCITVFDDVKNSFSDFINFVEKSKKLIPIITILKNKNYKIAYELLTDFNINSFFEEEIIVEKLVQSIDQTIHAFHKDDKFRLPLENNSIQCELSNAVSFIFQNSKIGAAIFDTDGIVQYVNPALESLFGVEVENFKKMGLAEICKSDPLKFDEEYNSFIQGKTLSFEQKKQFLISNGNNFHAHVSASLVKDIRNLKKLVLVTFTDISAEYELKEQLDKEKYFLQALLDNIPDAIYFKDENHRFTKVSKYVHLQGLEKPEDAIGKTDLDFFAKEHAEAALDDEKEIFKSGKPIINKLEKEVFPNGDIAWVSTTKVPLKNSNNIINGIVGISRDVTDAKIKELALQRSEERYRNLVEYSPDLIVVVYRNRIVYTNSAVTSLLGVEDKNNVINKNINEFIHPRFIKITSDYLERAYETKTTFKIPKFKLKNSSAGFVDVEVTGIPTSYNGKNSVQLVIRDITELRKQEKLKHTTLEILNASNTTKNLDELFNYIHRIIGRWMSVKNFYIALHNEETSMITFPYFIDEEEDFAPPQRFGNGLTEYIIRTGEGKLLTESQLKDLFESHTLDLVGAFSKVWLGVPLKIRDKTIGVLVVQDYHDQNVYSESDKEILELISFTVSRVIERKQADNERSEHIEQLKELHATKDRFFSFVSHDLRSPFSSLLGFTELVLEDYNNLSREEVKCYLDIINSSSKNLYKLLNNLLEFSRFQTGMIQYLPKEINLQELIAKNISLIEGNAIKKEIELINNIKNEYYVYVDEDMISSVLQNLLSNAIKFTSRKGIVKVNASLGEISGEIILSVEDNGLGMDKSVVDNLFKMDVIHSTSGTEKESGTGLGLLLTKEFVEKNKGSIWVESAPNKGTTFSFTLPLAE